MTNEFNTYIQKLKHYKELYLIDEESYGDSNYKELREMRTTLNDFIHYVELVSNPRPSQQGNWCDPFFVGDDLIKNK